MNHRITTIAGLVAVTAATAVLGTVTQGAQAKPTCTDGSVRCLAASVSPYAEPIDALGGRTLALYLAAHMSHRLA